MSARAQRRGNLGRTFSGARACALSCAMLAGAGLAAAVLSGCGGPGGTRYSGGPSTYDSTTWEPKTVWLVDTRSGRTIWSVDVPVGTSLSVVFAEGRGPSVEMPDQIVWQIRREGRVLGQRDNRVACPPSTARRLEWKLRDAPEYPADTLPAAAPPEFGGGMGG